MHELKEKILGYLSAAVIILLLASGIISKFFDFILWLVILDDSTPDVSLFGNIVVRVLTFLSSYSLVGLICDAFGYRKAKFKKASYYIISTILGFLFSYIIWTIEQYIVTILVILIAIVSVVFSFVIIRFINDKMTGVENE